MEDVVSTVKRQELKIGCIVVVQTYGRSGRYNPHLHIIMTSGKKTKDMIPKLKEDIIFLAEPYTQADPTMKSSLTYTGLQTKLLEMP